MQICRTQKWLHACRYFLVRHAYLSIFGPACLSFIFEPACIPFLDFYVSLSHFSTCMHGYLFWDLHAYLSHIFPTRMYLSTGCLHACLFHIWTCMCISFLALRDLHICLSFFGHVCMFSFLDCMQDPHFFEYSHFFEASHFWTCMYAFHFLDLHACLTCSLHFLLIFHSFPSNSSGFMLM